MITSITIKNIATYDQTGATISDLAKLNYFFGNNGCGKSTIAKYLQSLSDGNTNQSYASCSSEGYDSNEEEIIVFNQDFIENNFKKNDTFKGVFSLNQTNAQIDEQIKKNEKLISEKTAEQKNIENENSKLKTELDKSNEDLAELCFEKRNNFKSFSKIKLDCSGNKKNNLYRIKEILTTLKEPKPSFEEMENLYKKLYEEDLQEIDVAINIDLFNLILECQNKFNPLLEEIIVGKSEVHLAEMIDKYNLRNWVLQGKSYLEKTGKICPFCQQQISDEFISQLNDIFDESYRQKIEEIKKYRDFYEANFSNLLNNLQSVSKKHNPQNTVSNLLIHLRNIFDKNTKIIDEKIKSPNEKKCIELIEGKTIEMASEINNGIEQVNELVSSSTKHKEQLISEIWNYIAFDCKEDIGKHELADKQKEDRIEKNLSDIKNLKDNILNLKQDNEGLRTKTVNTKDAVDRINQILKNSGFMGFEIVEENKTNNISQYYLSRTNSVHRENVFNSLSEGERNFISFLYFYQLCLGTTDISANSSKKKIVVIDDPVSSMDSQVLFIVSTLLHKLIKHGVNNKEFDNTMISQVFILTHNLYFYKEISLKFRPVCGSKNHYRVYKNGLNVSFVESNGSNYNAIDDYSLMWKSLKEIRNKMKDNDKSQNILLANLFRRILESYVNFVGLGRDAWATISDDSIGSTEYDLKSAFISMINDGSHKVSPFDQLYFQKIHNAEPSKLFSVFESIFEGINAKDHYDKMMQ